MGALSVGVKGTAQTSFRSASRQERRLETPACSERGPSIGNRTSTKVGGDQSGSVGSLRSASYTANTVNQYTSRQVSTSIDVMGMANATANIVISINGSTQAFYRNSEYFQAVGNAGNSGGSVWTPVLVTATRGGRTVQQPASAPGHVLVPAASQTFTPDLDGNLLSDCLWNYTWDAENRLISMDCLVSGPTNQHLAFEYDWRGRRIRKTVKKSDYSIITDTKYLYDGWNLVAELNSANQLVRSYLWGPDLSGTAQGAGGVGGLLAVTYYGTATTNCFAAYDGNGNLTALVNAADGLVCARYEYGPFGELLRATGPMAKLNPFRFSTKYQDDETDLVYYGYRYYNASTGRWLSKDPLGDLSFRMSYLASLPPREQGIRARQLPTGDDYMFVENNPLNQIDRLGLCPSGTCDKWTIQFVLARTVFITGGGLDLRTRLIADKKCCIEPHERYYQYLGVGLGAGAGFSEWTINLRIGSKEFSTACVGWKDHEGIGRVTGWGLGIIFTFGQMIVTTPQTYLQITSPSYGYDFGIFTSIGDWRFEE